MNERTSSEAGASLDPAILKIYILKQMAPQELGKVLSIKFYAEVTKRNRDTNGLKSLKLVQSAIECYLKLRENSPQLPIVQSREFHNPKEIHRSIAPAVPSNSFSKDNETSQPTPQKKGRSSIIDSGDENRTLMHEIKMAVFVLTSELLVCLLCLKSFRHMTSFCILNKMSKRFRFRYF